MKRIAVLVAVGALLAVPAALAQSAPQSVPTPSTTPPQVPLREGDFFEPPARDSLEEVKGGFSGTDSPDGDDRTPDAVKGSFEGTDRMNVRGDFPATDLGS